MSLCFVPIRDNQRLMNEAIPIDGTEIYIKDLWQLTLSCCRNDKWPEYRKFLSKFTNIPRHMRFRCHDNDTNEYSLDLTGFRDQSTINNSDVVAPMYIDGGKKENKVLPYDDDNKITFVLVEGSVLIFRPPLQYRRGKWMRNLEYRVVAADADAGADDVVEEEVVPVVAVVDADAGVVDADDRVKEAEEEEELEVEEAEVVVVADDGVKEAGEQSIPAAVVEEDEEIDELGVKSQYMLIQERLDLAEESGQVVYLLEEESESIPAVVVEEENPSDEEEEEEENGVKVSQQQLPAVVVVDDDNEELEVVPAVVDDSTSYLAPFVASVLRDQVMADLLAVSKQKDERIQRQEEDRLRLEVTGRNGKPKYYKASMRDGQMTPTGNRFYVFFNRPLLPNFVDKIPRLEVRLGGVVVAPFCQMTVVTCSRAGFDRTRDDEPQLGRIQFFSNRNDGVQVFGCVGPILPSDYANLPHTMAVADLVRFVKHYQTINGPYMMCCLDILSIFVPKCQINGINFLDTPDKGTTTKNVWGEEKTIAVVDEAVPLVVVEEEIEDEVAQKDESIIVVPSNEVDGVEVPEEEEEEVIASVVAPVIDIPSFEEIQSAMGFSPLNDTIDPVPHDEDLLSWSLCTTASPRPNRRSIYDPIQIND